MVILSLFAIGAVSASEDVSDTVVMSDIEDGATVGSGIDEVVEDGENPGTDPNPGTGEPGTGDNPGTDPNPGTGEPGTGDNPGTGDQNNPTTPTNPMENFFGNGSFDMGGMGDMSQYMNMNMSSFMGMFGDMDMGSLMGMFGGAGATNTIKASNLNKYYTKTTSYKVTLLDSSNKAVAGKYVVFTINNKEYNVKTNSKGVATLKLKLKPGTYYITAEYDNVIVKKRIKIKNVLTTKNLVKKVKKLGKFNVKVLNSKGKPYAKRIVKIKFRGKTYKIKTNKKGIATFKVSKKLKKGKYTIKTMYNGLTRTNKITVK